MPGLEFIVHASDDTIVVEVAGEIDLATAPLLEDTLTATPANMNVVVDLTYVTFLDARGIAALVAARDTLRARGSTLMVANPVSHVARVLMLADASLHVGWGPTM